MEQASEFLLAYQKLGSDSLPARRRQRARDPVGGQDPTTDLAADQALFPATVSAATLLNTDSSLVAQLKTAEGEIEPYARTDAATHEQLLNAQPTSASAAASVDAGGTDVIADSYQPSATLHNGENIGLEPVWPYGVIGDSTTVNGDNLTALADRTYNSRPNVNNPDWSFDAVDAARLDMPSQVESDLVAITESYQSYISGLGNLSSGTIGDEPYIEQSSTVATAMDEALATDYDGTLRIAPAWPSGWDAAGTVYIQGGSKVDVQIEGGVITTAAIQAGTTADHDRPQPVARPAGGGGQRVHRRRGRRRDHQRHVQRPGDGWLVVPDRAAVVAHHLAPVRPGHRHPGDRREAPRGQGPDRPRPGRRLREPGRLLQRRRHHRRHATPRRATTTAAAPASPRPR